MLLEGKTILITGGTGSFGQALVKTLLKHYNLKKIIIFSRDELKHFEMQNAFDSPVLRFFIGDVREYDRVKQAFEGVDVVIHAAALKQVIAAEYNPMECIKTNILGAENVIRAATETGVKQVVALSTDKAANPINLYGASKLASDKLFTAANNMVGSKPLRFAVVRYGNVIGSRGSVVPYFQKLLDHGATVLPITDPRMTRFWLPLQQGVNFVLSALGRMQGGEVFVPKIPSIRMVDLAEAMAPGVSIQMVGIRPGEKIHEVMCPLESAYQTLEFSDHYVIRPTIQLNQPVDHSVNLQGEQGVPVSLDFEYHSGTNPWFLSVEEIREGLPQYVQHVSIH